MSGWVEDGRIPVGVGERLSDRAFGQPGDLLENAARGVGVHVSERLGAQQVLPAQDLEQVEFNVPEVALEVPHCCSPSPSVTQATHQ